MLPWLGVYAQWLEGYDQILGVYDHDLESVLPEWSVEGPSSLIIAGHLDNGYYWSMQRVQEEFQDQTITVEACL